MSTMGICQNGEKLTRAQKDLIVNAYEEAKLRPSNSKGAWHTQLMIELQKAGYDVRSYQEAKQVAERILYRGR